MGTRVSPERRIYESARDRDLEGVFSGLMLLVAEALYKGDDMPEYTIPALRQWVSLERGTPKYLNIKLSGMVDKTGLSLVADHSPDEVIRTREH